VEDFNNQFESIRRDKKTDWLSIWTIIEVKMLTFYIDFTSNLQDISGKFANEFQDVLTKPDGVITESA